MVKGGPPAPGPAAAGRRRGRKRSLTPEQIARAALEVADAEGLDAVTIKRISESLEVGTMTLYVYVRTKEEILAAMTEIAVSEVDLDLPGRWDERLFAYFSRLH